MEQKAIYEALGLEMPSETPDAANPDSAVEPEGENGQAVAGPANEKEGREPELIGERGMDSPRPAATPLGEGDREGDMDSPRPAGSSLEEESMPKEERARQARLRREREQKAAIEKALAEQEQAQEEKIRKAVDDALAEERGKRDAELKGFFERAQLRNTITDQPITSLEEFNAWEKAFGDRKLEQSLKAGKLGMDELNRAIEQNPVIRQMQQQQSQQTKQAMQAQQKQAMDAVIARELAEIRKLDPSIKSLEDALALETGPEFSRLVQENHLTFPQAFRLANEERLRQTQSMAAQEAAARAYHSKDHLKSIGTRGGEGVVVPKETMQIYRAMMPELSDEQIRQEYARQHKAIGNRQ